MNVLFILGNGFDKAQGLATSYPEFYDAYKKIKPDSELEARLQREIQSDYETWADLEEGLGKYSAQFTDVNEFREVLQILNARLKDYLKSQTLRTDTLGLSRQKLINNLLNPDAGLEPKQRADYNSFYNSLSPAHVYVDCITFNYTDTFETVYSDKKEAFLGHKGSKNVPVYLKEFQHIHGSLENMILVGVNDISQIANESFRENAELREEFVKPEINNGCENMMNETFRQLINDAHLIVMFGVSVGITDSFWWQAIGKRLDQDDNLRLIYYPYDVFKDTEKYPYRKLRWSRDYISFLKDRMGIQASVDDLRYRVYIGINKPFLKLV